MDPAPAPAPDLAPVNAGSEGSPDGIASLLATARRRINEGNPTLALQAVIFALRAYGGERAVMQTLGRAREIYHTRRQSNEAVDELSALLAECALATELAAGNGADVRQRNSPSVPAEPSETQVMDTGEQQNHGRYSPSAPILAESGRLQVVMDASSDGSSFVCVQCGGVVSNQRRDEHFAFWCSRELR